MDSGQAMCVWVNFSRIGFLKTLFSVTALLYAIFLRNLVRKGREKGDGLQGEYGGYGFIGRIEVLGYSGENLGMILRWKCGDLKLS